MSQATIRSRLDTIVSAVSNIGVVHDYERFSSDMTAFMTLFKTTISGTDQIRGWTIGYNGYSTPDDDEFPREFGHRFIRLKRFKIRGYQGLDDSAETEKTFAALVEDVCSAIDGDATLNDKDTYYLADYCVVPVFDLRIFGSVLCHYCEIDVNVAEFTDE